MSEKPVVFSFFSGAGFLDLGFEMAGFRVAHVNEVFPPFLETYKYSRKSLQLPSPEYGYYLGDAIDFIKEPQQSRLRELVSETHLKNSIIGFIGGSPCPDFSVGGKNKGKEGDQGKLSATYIEIISQQKPDFFLFENVEGLWKTKKHRAFFDEIKRKLQKQGYITTERLINSIEYGVPQDRNRIILIGFQKDLLINIGINLQGSELTEGVFPWESYIVYPRQKAFSYPWISTNAFQEDSEIPCPDNIPQELTVEHWFKQNDVYNHPNSIHHFKPRQGIARFKSVDEGDDSRKSFKRLHRWRYSPTVCYGNNEVHLHPYKIRRISVSEALALQSLPQTFILPDHLSLTNMFKLIGNGVPYLAANAIALSIIKFLDLEK
jgi:DNA (cytosine-5)-methyltransferase 1